MFAFKLVEGCRSLNSNEMLQWKRNTKHQKKNETPVFLGGYCESTQ